jgi:hypothetical protein
MYFVPEGQHDRSLARSAWESVYRENRPVGYGVIGRSYPTRPGGISSKMCAVFLRKAICFVFEISSLQIKIAGGNIDG